MRVEPCTDEWDGAPEHLPLRVDTAKRELQTRRRTLTRKRGHDGALVLDFQHPALREVDFCCR